jgi:cytochrome c5
MSTMSTTSDQHRDDFEEAHTGPIKTPKQMLWTSIAAFVVPVFIIIGLVNYVTSYNKPAAGAVEMEKALAQRIAKVGTVAVRDPNRTPDSGETVFKGQCISCHGGNGPGPNLGDKAAWAPRVATGYEALMTSVLKGKGGMAAQGGGDYSDHELARAVVYMANAGGASFAEPAAPAKAVVAAPAAPVADDAAVKAAAAQIAAVGTGAAAVVAAAPATAPAAKPAAAGGAGEALYNAACVACHAAGVAGAPKLGDKAAWAPRLAAGVDGLTASVIKGKGAMPPKGGSQASDADIKASVQYMLASVK